MTNMTFRTDLSTAEYRKFDPFLPGITAITDSIRLIHDGVMFGAGDKVTGWTTTSTYEWFLKTGAKKVFWHGMNFQFGRGDIDIEAFTGTTVSANGTSVTLGNFNLNSSHTPLSTFFTQPTVTTAGTQLDFAWVPPTAAGVGSSANGQTDLTDPNLEWVLEPNTNYLIRITNNSGATIDFSWFTRFHEADYPE